MRDYFAVILIATACLLPNTVLASNHGQGSLPIPQTSGGPGQVVQDFIPIAPIPFGDGRLATSGSLSDYINALFRIALAAGAALAAIYIAIGGFEYIFSEATQSKHDGRERITNALFGLAILLLVTLILFVINPDLICLKIFESGGMCGNP